MMTAEVLRKNFPFNEQIRIGNKHHMWKKIIDAVGIGIYIEKYLLQVILNFELKWELRQENQ